MSKKGFKRFYVTTVHIELGWTDLGAILVVLIRSVARLDAASMGFGSNVTEKLSQGIRC